MNPTSHTLEITIDSEGNIVSTVKGVAGPDCAKLTRWLDELGQVKVDRNTPDFGKQPDVRIQVG